MSKHSLNPVQEFNEAVKSFDGDTSAYRAVFDAIERSIPFSQALLISTFPRGGTQILQPSNTPDGLLRAYKGLFADDGPTWQAILKDAPVTGKEAVASGTLESSAYFQGLMAPNKLAHVAAVRLPGPLIKGYPGALHLYRKMGDAPFSPDELKKLGAFATQLSLAIESSREARVRHSCGIPVPWEHLDITRQFVFDRHGRQLTLFQQKKIQLDDGLKHAIKKLVSSRIEEVNGEAIRSDRVELPDSNGEKWAFRAVVHREFSALGDGPYVFLCIQPPACEWNAVRPGDFQADAEVARLVPALKFMHQEFRRVPTLNEIAAKGHLSPFHFHRRFTELFGMTPKHFLLSCQIAKAKRMLVERKVPLAEIAADCGFAHQSHFTSRFKQAAGLTPTRWRRHASEHFAAFIP